MKQMNSWPACDLRMCFDELNAGRGQMEDFFFQKDIRNILSKHA